MERQISNCSKIAAFLEKHPLVRKINYPGLAAHPRSEVQSQQALSGGSLLSFETGRYEALLGINFPVPFTDIYIAREYKKITAQMPQVGCSRSYFYWKCKFDHIWSLTGSNTGYFGVR